MSVSALSPTGDWTFGSGRGNYLTGSKEVLQNVVTRIKEFRNDWALDISAGIDWFVLLGLVGTENTIISEVSRVTLETDGVASVNSVTITRRDVENRELFLTLSYTDIYGNELITDIGVQ